MAVAIVTVLAQGHHLVTSARRSNSNADPAEPQRHQQRPINGVISVRPKPSTPPDLVSRLLISGRTTPELRGLAARSTIV